MSATPSPSSVAFTRDTRPVQWVGVGADASGRLLEYIAVEDEPGGWPVLRAMPATTKVLLERPITVGAQARPLTIRLDAARRAELDEAAQERHITPLQLMRELIDAL